MKATIDLENNKNLYVVKGEKLIEYELPDYGEVTVVMHDGQVERFEETKKRKV